MKIFAYIVVMFSIFGGGFWYYQSTLTKIETDAEKQFVVGCLVNSQVSSGVYQYSKSDCGCALVTVRKELTDLEIDIAAIRLIVFAMKTAESDFWLMDHTVDRAEFERRMANIDRTDPQSKSEEQVSNVLERRDLFGNFSDQEFDEQMSKISRSLQQASSECGVNLHY